MRTTVTLDPDVASLVRRLMDERGLTFKEAVNRAIRAGLAPERGEAPFSQESFAMGPPAVPLTKALVLAAELEDEDLTRRMEIGK
jgi:hypothetical protein